MAVRGVKPIERVRRLLISAVLGALVLATLPFPLSSTAASRTPNRCTRLAFSPNFSRDGTGFCAGSVLDPASASITAISLYRTKDGGRSWKQRSASGIPVSNSDAVLGELVVSPDFATDSTIYIHTAGGLYRSSDEGETFTLADPLSGSEVDWDRLTPYVESTPVGVRQVSFAWANRTAPARISPPLHAPVAGAPADEAMFLIPRGTDPITEETYAVGIVGGGPQGDPLATAVFSCVYPFNCATTLYRFPDNLYFEDAWLDGDFEKSETMYVALKGHLGTQDHRRLWRSTDRGRTFTPLKKVNRLLGPPSERRKVEFDLAMHSGSRTMFLMVDTMFEERWPQDPPAHQLFRSRNGGRSWKRIAFGRHFEQKGAGGALWNEFNLIGPDLHLLPGGKLMAIGTNFEKSGIHEGPYCSTDGGRNWSKTCRTR